MFSLVRSPALLALAAALVASACPGRPLTGDPADDAADAGTSAADAGTSAVDAGPHGVDDAGTSGVDAGEEGEGEGEGEPVDAGNGFDLGDLLVDGGVPGLECLPEELPALSISGAIDALGLGLYSGQRESGVRCGDVTCGDATPCCGLCGFAGCGVDVTDAGAPECPFFASSYACDDEGDCSGSAICCFTLNGTECRAEEDCDFDVGSLTDFFGDGGLVFPDAGLSDHDAGFLDGGFVLEPVDGGEDGGFVEVPVPGPAAPFPDAGSFLDGLQSTLEQGVPVCTSTLFDCEILQGEACCSSDRLVVVDVGFCLPALLCLGDFLP